MVPVENVSAPYRIYVLFVLFLACISNMATRNLPTYLVTVPVPVCQRICVGVPATTMCKYGKEVSIAVEDTQNPHYQACQQCLAAFASQKGFVTHPHNVDSPMQAERTLAHNHHMLRPQAARDGPSNASSLRHLEHKDDFRAPEGYAGLDHTLSHGTDLPKRIVSKAMPLKTAGQAFGAIRTYKVGEARVIASQSVWADSKVHVHSPPRFASGVGIGPRGVVGNIQPQLGKFRSMSKPFIELLQTPVSAAPKLAPNNTAGDEFYSMAFYNLAEGVCMHQWQYGIFIGYGFALSFAVGSLIAGQTCDRHPRVAVISIAIITWSVAMSMQASAHTFIFLFICRCIIGLAQAFAIPAAISIIVDYFGDRHGAASVLLAAGVYLGSGLASFSVLLAENVGWRWVVLLSGLSGIVVALLLYCTVREPDRTEWCAPCSLSVVTHEVFDKSRVARLLLVAASCKMFAAYTVGAFLPFWFVRSGLRGYTVGTYAAWNTIVVAGAGMISTLVSGFVGGIRDPRAPCWAGAIGSAMSLPLMYGITQANHFCVSMLCLFTLLVVNDSWLGPAISLLRVSVRRSVSGQAESVFMVAATLMANIGPAIIGLLDTGGDSLGPQLSCVVAIANIAAIAACVCTAREVSIDPVAASAGVKFDSITGPCSIRLPSSPFPSIRTTPWFF